MFAIITFFNESWTTYPVFFISFFSLFEFFWNNFKLSNNIYFRIVQIISFIFLISFTILVFLYVRNNLIIDSYQYMLPQDSANNTDPHIEAAKTFTKAVSEPLVQMTDKIGNVDFLSSLTSKVDNCLEKFSQFTDVVDKVLIKTLSKGNKYTVDWNAYYAYLDTLSILEVSALFHILIFILLFLLTFNILSAFFGNEIINYFNLENKFPKLYTFFKLRQKFQRFYLFLNIFAMFIIMLAVIAINLLILIK